MTKFALSDTPAIERVVWIMCAVLRLVGEKVAFVVTAAATVDCPTHLPFFVLLSSLEDTEEEAADNVWNALNSLFKRREELKAQPIDRVPKIRL